MTNRHSGKLFFQSPWSVVTGMLLFFAFSILSLQSKGQSFFYFENNVAFSNNPPLKYYTFLILENDGTANARVLYVEPSSGDSCLVEFSMADSINTEINNTNENKYMVPFGTPRLIKGTKNSGIAIPRFIFTKQVAGDESFYMCHAAEFKGSEGNWVTAEMVINQEKDFKELPKDPNLLLQFYKPEDAFFKYVFKPLSRGPSGIVRKEKLFLILVANTNDSSIGVSAKKDFDNISRTFTGLAKDLGMEIAPTYISGDGFTKQAIESAVDKLTPSPIDIVVFYYSGHGFRFSDDDSKYPRISTRTNSKKKQKISQHNLSLEKIYNQIIKMGARVNIVLGDCCNENIRAANPLGKDILQPRGSDTWPGKLNMENCNALLFPEKPISILIGAAEKNQLATGNPAMGGFFTAFFKTELDKSLYGFNDSKSWKKILQEVKTKASRQALTAECGTGRCVQRAEIMIVPEL